MYEFLVLGIIPGTNITITFNAWLLAAAALAGGTAVYRLHRSGAFRNAVITLSLVAATHRQLRA